MRTHISIIGIVNTVLGGIGTLFGLALMIGLPLLGLFDLEALLPMSIVGAFAGGFVLLVSLPSVIFGLGLMARKEWGRIGTIVLSVFSLLNFPLGTAWGAYSLWAMFQPDTRLLISERSSY